MKGPPSPAELEAARERAEALLYPDLSEGTRARRLLWSGGALGLVLLGCAVWWLKLPPKSERIPPPDDPSRKDVPLVRADAPVLSEDAKVQAERAVTTLCEGAPALCDDAKAWHQAYRAVDCVGARTRAVDLHRASPAGAGVLALESLTQRLCARLLFVR